MADKNRIEIEVAAQGGREAAAEIQIAEDAAKAAAAAADERAKKQAEWDAAAKQRQAEAQASGGTRGFGGMLDSSPERTDETLEAADKIIEKTEEATAAVEEQAEAVKDLGEASEEAGEKAEKLDENVDKIARVQKAQAVALLAAEVGKIGGRFREAADEVEEFDKEAALALRNTADHIEDVTSAVSSVALAFAVGGPLGGALAALGVLIGEVANKFQESEIAALRAAAAEKKAMEDVTAAANENVTALEERQTALANAAVLTALDNERTKVQAITKELQTQLDLTRQKRRLENEVLTARDQTDLAQVDYDQTTGKLTPLEAAGRRAEIESSARKRGRDERKKQAIEDASAAVEEARLKAEAAEKARKLAAELEAKTNEASNQAKQLTDYADGEIGKMVPSEKTGELSNSDRAFATQMTAEIERAQSVLKALEDASAKAKEEAAAATVAAREAATVAKGKTGSALNTVAAMDMVDAADSETGELRGRTAAQEALAAARKREEAREKQRIQKEESERRQSAAVKQSDEREGASISQGAFGAARSAEKMGVPGRSVAALERAASELARNPTDGANLEKVEQLVEKVVQWAERAGKANEEATSKLQSLDRRIDVLQGQIKNTRWK